MVRPQNCEKYVPIVCYTGADSKGVCWCKMKEKDGGEWLIYDYKRHSSYRIADFAQCAIICFDYVPDMIQTDLESDHILKTTHIYFGMYSIISCTL